jgi:hypothetical protein
MSNLFNFATAQVYDGHEERSSFSRNDNRDRFWIGTTRIEQHRVGYCHLVVESANTFGSADAGIRSGYFATVCQFDESAGVGIQDARTEQHYLGFGHVIWAEANGGLGANNYEPVVTPGPRT